MISKQVLNSWVANLRTHSRAAIPTHFLQRGRTRGTRYSPLGILARTVDKNKRTWHPDQFRYGDQLFTDDRSRLGGFLSKAVTRKLYTMGVKGVAFSVVADWIEQNVKAKRNG